MKFYIIGAGGLAKDILHTIEEINKTLIYPPYIVEGFIDEDKSRFGESHQGIPIKGDIDYLLSLEGKPNAICAIGDCRVKKRIVESLGDKVNWINIIHPGVTHPSDWNIGIGNFIYAYATISRDAKIGNHNFLNVYTATGHDVTVGNYCTINDSVTIVTGAEISDGCFIGAHSVIYGEVKIGEGCIIGAGSIIGFNVPPNVMTMVEKPRIIKKLPEFYESTIN